LPALMSLPGDPSAPASEGAVAEAEPTDAGSQP
jgi:hypothetical protein